MPHYVCKFLIAMAPSLLTKTLFIVDYSEVWPSFHETVLFPTLKKSRTNNCQRINFKGEFNFALTFT